ADAPAADNADHYAQSAPDTQHKSEEGLEPPHDGDGDAYRNQAGDEDGHYYLDKHGGASGHLSADLVAQAAHQTVRIVAVGMFLDIVEEVAVNAGVDFGEISRHQHALRTEADGEDRPEGQHEPENGRESREQNRLVAVIGGDGVDQQLEHIGPEDLVECP